MKTIQEVFSENLIRLRGDRSQEDTAWQAKVPIASYQRAENGVIPQRVNLVRLAKVFDIPETRLFLDPDLTAPTPAQAVAVLAEFVKERSMDKPIQTQADLEAATKENQRLTEKVEELETIISQGHHIASRLARLCPEQREEIRALIEQREATKAPASARGSKSRDGKG